jgi:Ca-activated chloride channel family protein
MIKGTIKRREEARAIYEAARASGRIAGLLDQERPNIFTQAVANIVPGATVKITISYVEALPYEAGSYEFVFPMVVGPRYMPRSVSDAGRIAPPVTEKGTRAGHDVSIEIGRRNPEQRLHPAL